MINELKAAREFEAKAKKELDFRRQMEAVANFRLRTCEPYEYTARSIEAQQTARWAKAAADDWTSWRRVRARLEGRPVPSSKPVWLNPR